MIIGVKKKESGHSRFYSLLWSRVLASMILLGERNSGFCESLWEKKGGHETGEQRNIRSAFPLRPSSILWFEVLNMPRCHA
jgi:hypothetical protein